MAKSAFISDGYTIDSVIEETEFHPAVRVKFRPLLKAEARKVMLKISELERKGGKLTDGGIDVGEKHAAEVIARQIANWDITAGGDDGSESIVAINSENVLRIEATLQAKLFALVTGMDAPTWDDDSSKN